MKKMKKLILSAVALLTFGFSNAQEQTAKGKILIEANTGSAMIGTTSLTYASQDGNSNYNVGLDGGYFVINNLALKAGLGYGGQKDDFSDTNTFSYRLGAKYYIVNQFPVGLDLTGASIKDAAENPMWLGIQGGYALFLGNNVALEPSVRYNHSLNENYTDKGVFQFNVGFSLFF
jgi:hypothetical protein